MKHPAKDLKDRIVSLPKPYVRPIVRGKENKPVEFGMKVHMLQVDGICIIDSINFNAFNECKRLKMSILKHKSLFGSCNQVSADRIYATNENRRYTTQKGIFNSFVKKGPKPSTKEESRLKSLLSAARATVMEGSFGNHKEHYGLRKIKAKTQKNEIIWMFFGVMASNAVIISRRRDTQEHSPPLNQAA